jgi:hypothetical protein
VATPPSATPNDIQIPALLPPSFVVCLLASAVLRFAHPSLNSLTLPRRLHRAPHNDHNYLPPHTLARSGMPSLSINSSSISQSFHRAPPLCKIYAQYSNFVLTHPVRASLPLMLILQHADSLNILSSLPWPTAKPAPIRTALRAQSHNAYLGRYPPRHGRLFRRRRICRLLPWAMAHHPFVGGDVLANRSPVGQTGCFCTKSVVRTVYLYVQCEFRPNVSSTRFPFHSLCIPSCLYIPASIRSIAELHSTYAAALTRFSPAPNPPITNTADVRILSSPTSYSPTMF